MPKKVTKRPAIKLFVWRDVLRDYTGGIACAAARTVEEARTAILKAAKDDCQLSTLAGQILVNAPEILDVPAGAYISGGQ